MLRLIQRLNLQNKKYIYIKVDGEVEVKERQMILWRLPSMENIPIS